jgi:hypothetical protein
VRHPPAAQQHLDNASRGITADELIPPPQALVNRNGVPDTIAGWKALGDGLLTGQSCAFHRNLEISSRYAWLYKFLPAYFKWAGMAAFASHHVRLTLFPFRLDRDRTGYARPTTRSSTTSSGRTSCMPPPRTGSDVCAASSGQTPTTPPPWPA